jgi:hypothetical protein
MALLEIRELEKKLAKLELGTSEYKKTLALLNAEKKKEQDKISALQIKSKAADLKKETEKKAKEKSTDLAEIKRIKDYFQRNTDLGITFVEPKFQNRLKELLAKYPSESAPPNQNSATIGTNTELSSNNYLSNYDLYTLNADGSVAAPGGNQVIIVSLPDPKGGELIAQDFASTDAARTAYVKAYASGPGGVDTLKKQLINSKYLTPKMAASVNWYEGLDDMISDYTVSVVSNAKLSGAKKIQPITSFIKMKSGSAGDTGVSRTSKYQVITTRGDAKRQLDSYLNDLRGSASTPEELDAYFDELSQREGKAIRTEKDGVYTGSVLEDADRLLIAAKVAKKSLGGIDVEALLKSSKGSRASMDITDLQSYASSYGIEISAAEALKYVVAGLGQTDYLKKQQERIRQLGITLHPNLKGHIEAGGTVADVADQYAIAKSRKLGVTIKTSTLDKDVMKAVANGTLVSDFEREMQGKDEWKYTEEAANMATSFTNTFLKSFGLVG